MVIGAARPSDFDEHVQSLLHLPNASDIMPRIEANLRGVMSGSLAGSGLAADHGENAWWRGVPDVFGNVDGEGAMEARGASVNPKATNFLMSLWCYRLIKGWGMLEYCQSKIQSNLLSNLKKWNQSIPYDDNVRRMNSWGPGTALAAGDDALADWDGALAQVSPNGQLLSRRGRSLRANASGFDTHRDSISSRFDCRCLRRAAASW
jgi:hypothetical protein